MTYDFCGKKVRGRFAFPSGIVATTIDTARLMLKSVPEIGIYESKVITINPEQGNPEDILCQMGPGSFVNAVRFANPGLEEMIQEIGELRESAGKDVFIMPQIGEATPDEFVHCVREFERNGALVDGYSANLSCPHAKARGITIGNNPDSVYDVFRQLRRVTSKSLFIKAAAGFEEQIAAALKGGATGAIGINTLRVDAPELWNEFGGMSGAQLFPVTLENVRRIRKRFPDMPMAVMGGISGASQIMQIDSEFPGLFYGIGTALAGMDTEQVIRYFHELGLDLKNRTENAEKLAIDRIMMEYKPFIVKEVERYGKEICLVKFFENLDARPGQFVFVKTDNKHSKPFSVADDSEGLEIVVRGVGETSKKITELKPNSVVRIRGPYGAEFEMPKGKPAVFIGAGCGIAPVHHAASHHNGQRYFLVGAKTGEELVYLSRLAEMGPVYMATENGTEGTFRGNIVEMLRKNAYKSELRGANYFVCGPEVAMKGLHPILLNLAEGDRSKINYLVERMTKCGVGLCGSCAIPSGERSCVDGPVFTAVQFSPGTYKRDKAGARVKF